MNLTFFTHSLLIRSIPQDASLDNDDPQSDDVSLSGWSDGNLENQAENEVPEISIPNPSVSTFRHEDPASTIQLSIILTTLCYRNLYYIQGDEIWSQTEGGHC